MATGVTVSKEYVREQLRSMGVSDLSEKELEAYTNDFAKLIQKHLQDEEKTSSLSQTSSRLESFTSNSSHSPYSGQESLRDHRSYQRKSAVYKTFPGDKENRVYPVSTSSVTPSTLLRPADTPAAYTSDHHSLTDQRRPLSLSSSSSVESDGMTVTNKPIVITRKRKVLRQVNGEARVFDESYCSEVSPSTRNLAGGMAHLSLTPLTPSDSSTLDSSSSSSPASTSTITSSSSSSSSSTLSLRDSHKPAPHRTQCKSFIRPSTAQLYTRHYKKHDPVNRYHYWKEVWEKEKFPGGDRNALRWKIREQMAQQDQPAFVPPKRPVRVNNYKVPTDKKRSSLRWEIRHQMAEQ